MSTKRTGLSAWQWDRKYGIEYGPNGFRLCRLCKTETTYKRATLCSEACGQKWSILTSPSYARQLVFNRDKGICALCGLDTEMLREMVNAPGQAYSKAFWGKDRPRSRAAQHAGHWWFHPLLKNRTSLWDADHIVPVVEGGGECDLDNLRTLCLGCHKRVTAELRQRLAKPKPIRRMAAASQSAMFAADLSPSPEPAARAREEGVG